MNTKIAIFALVAAFCILHAAAIPVHDDLRLDSSESSIVIKKRATYCDSANNAANEHGCNAHCVAQNYKQGGSCQSVGVCLCKGRRGSNPSFSNF